MQEELEEEQPSFLEIIPPELLNNIFKVSSCIRKIP